MKKNKKNKYEPSAIKECPYLKGKIIVGHKLVDFYISHIEEYGPNDFGETFEMAIGWNSPIGPMSMVGENQHTHMRTSYDSILFD